jgi:hypothetical protein
LQGALVGGERRETRIPFRQLVAQQASVVCGIGRLDGEPDADTETRQTNATDKQARPRWEAIAARRGLDRIRRGLQRAEQPARDHECSQQRELVG